MLSDHVLLWLSHVTTKMSASQIVSGWSEFFLLVHCVFEEAERKEHSSSRNVVESIAEIECCLRSVGQLRDCFVSASASESELQANPHEVAYISNCLARLWDCLHQEQKKWWEKLDVILLDDGSPSVQSDLVTINTGIPGRPRICIDIEQVHALRGLHMTWMCISTILGVSRTTLYRRCKESGYSDENLLRRISDDGLIAAVRDIKSRMPDIGERMVSGHLRAQGVTVARDRVREMIHSVDPLTSLRWNPRIARRTYSVPGPNSFVAYR